MSTCPYKSYKRQARKALPWKYFTQAFTLFRIEKPIFVIHQKNDDYGNNGPLYSI
jgi:hypothetical protein